LPADRRLIEETASAVLDALPTEESGAFREEWAGVQRELIVGRGPEEVEALGHRATLEELASYLDNAAGMVGADLTLMDPELSGEDRATIAVGRAAAEAAVNRYESVHASS